MSCIQFYYSPGMTFKVTDMTAEFRPQVPKAAHDGLQDVYWLRNSHTHTEPPSDLLRNVDVAIVGSGYTGLHAALVTARAGRSTLVLEAGDVGWGCSTRNGGQISTSIKPSFEKLSKRYGAERARNIRQEGLNALDWIEEFIQSAQIECNFGQCGRYHAAHTPKHYEDLLRASEKLNKTEGADAFAVPRDEQRREVGSDAYFGGVVFPHHAALDPGKYHQGLLRLAQDTGVQVTGNCHVRDIEKQQQGFLLNTAKGVVHARDVVIATGGYSGPLSDWLQRRIIPIGSYIIATDPLPPSLMDELLPTDRIVNDTCKVVYYYRASPDRTRILFGGRVSAKETDPAVSGPRLHTDMCRVFPQLTSYGVSHSWTGTVGYTFDELPHIGIHDGLHYAVGYCGTGVSLASYLGMRIGQKVLGHPEGRTALDGLPFPTRPFYRGNPWFLPAAVTWYRWRDSLEYKLASRLK